MTYVDNRYRVVHECDRHEEGLTFKTLQEAQHFSRSGRYIILAAVEAEDGSVFEWQSTSLSQSPGAFARTNGLGEKR